MTSQMGGQKPGKKSTRDRLQHRQLYHMQLSPKTYRTIRQMLGRAYLEGSNVDDFLARVLCEHPQHGQLSTDGFAGACGRSQQHILICMVYGVESLHRKQGIRRGILQQSYRYLYKQRMHYVQDIKAR